MCVQRAKGKVTVSPVQSKGSNETLAQDENRGHEKGLSCLSNFIKNILNDNNDVSAVGRTAVLPFNRSTSRTSIQREFWDARES